MLNQIWHILTELSPWLLLGAAVAGLMHLLVPADRLHKLLRGPGSLLASVIVGIPLPLCSCSVIPVGVGLRKEGASRGASVGFLISTPQTGVDSILVSGSMLGWPFALFKVAAALVMGIFGGGLVQRFGENQDQIDDGEAGPARTSTRWAARIREATAHSVELIRSIWRWLVVGILVSATISWWLPASQLSGVAGTTGIVAMVITLLISLPLYVCATASVPIAAALVHSGLPAGAAMVFLMAGPATNLATLGAVFRTFGLRSTGLYLLTMIGGSLTAGVLFDSLLSATSVPPLHVHDNPHWIAVVCSLLLLGLFLRFTWEDVGRSVATLDASTEHQTWNISGMHCENCASGLERDLRQLNGVDDVLVHFSSQEAVIRGKPNPKEVTQIAEIKGFTATRQIQNDGEAIKTVTH